MNIRATHSDATCFLPQKNVTQAYHYEISGCEETLPLKLHPCLLDNILTEDKQRLQRWMNTPHVEQYWQQAWPQERIDAYLMQQIKSYHRIFFIYAGDQAVAYTELYPIADDSLSNHCQHHENDWGWHLLIGPHQLIGSGLANAIGHSIVSYIFQHTDSTHVFCEPDHRNERMIKLVSKLGHVSKGTVQLNEKCAELMVCDRQDFQKIPVPPIPATALTALKKLSIATRQKDLTE